MYITKVRLQNIRSFEDATIELEGKAGWNVILGDNGVGKSTLIKSISLALIGDPEVHVLGYKQSWKSWLRNEEEKGEIRITQKNEEIRSIVFQKQLRKPNSPVDRVMLKDVTPNNYNFFSAGYGSFRRLTGGSPDYDNIWNSNPMVAAHLSVFGEDVALDKVLGWLSNLQQKSLELGRLVTSNSQYTAKEREEIEYAYNLENKITEFIDSSSLLPTEDIYLAFPEGPIAKLMNKDNEEIGRIHIEDLSDGYKSVLALVLELIRQLLRFNGEEIDKVFGEEDGKLKVIAKGVVLIDEVAAHLHPSWQARIGFWFTEYFPNIQFIVSTHSPIICRSAKNGSIQKIRQEEGQTVIETIEGAERNQLLYGNILDAYETNLFGENISRSKESLEKLERLSQLRVRKRFGGDLTAEEENELVELSKIFLTDAPHPFA